MNDDQLLDTARRVFHARTHAEVGAAVAGVPDDQLPRVAVMVADMEARRAQFLDGAEAMIRDHGYMVQAVMGGDASPWFAYTAGLHPRHPAEIIARGFGPATSDIVYAAVRWVEAGDLRLVPGDYRFPDGGQVRIVPWQGRFEDVAMAVRHHRGQGRWTFPVMHVLVADDEGRFPGDPGCTVAEHQLRGLP